MMEDSIEESDKSKSRSLSIDNAVLHEFVIVGIDPVSQWSGIEFKL